MDRTAALIHIGFASAAALLWPALSASGDLVAQAVQITEAELSVLYPRSIGPAVTGGRITDLAVQADDHSTMYVATAAGGVWKSTNAGQTFTPIFDDQPVSTFGDIAIAPSNPNILYAGTGEQNNRNSTSWGNGVYRSDDGGDSWSYLGLVGTRHVGKIVVHPTDPDIAWVAGLGNLWAPNEQRGVFRTMDGGRSWEKVLYVDEFTGGVDLEIDSSNPDVLYAAMYQRERKAWGFNGGGPGSGIYKSTDGGTTWAELTQGLPEVDMGRIGIAISDSDPNILMALVEAPNRPEPGAAGRGRGGRGGGRGGAGRGRGRGGGGPPNATGTYRSENGGATWEKVNDQNGRPMYYSHIFVHPRNPNLVFSSATQTTKSTDGGRNWSNISAQPSYDVGVHLDMHAMWFDPDDEEHFFLAGDGGLHETFDGGVNYRKINTFAVGQFYGIGVDMREPYYVYGGMQDNHSWMGPSETRHFDGILNDDWLQIGFSDGMYQQIDLAGPRFVYSSATQGSYTRVDVIAGTKRAIRPQAPAGEQYRYDWTSPGLASIHAEGLFYMGGNRLFISRDFGETFEATEELDRGIDVGSLELMGVPYDQAYISRNDGVGGFGVTSTLAESPIDMSVLWVGMDDGNLQVSQDQGRSWTEVSRNVPGLPDGTYVSRVAGSMLSRGTAYATFDGHRDGDFAPYAYKTTDFGASWTPINAGLPEGSVSVIVEHPDNGDVLFLGTEHSAWVSTTAGRQWTKLQNVPTTSYDDMLIHRREKDLVMGTHGRSVWILDDTRFFAEWGEAQEAAAHLFAMDNGTLFRYRKENSYRAQAAYAGENPPDGVEMTYRLGSGSGAAELEITRDGMVVRRIAVPGTSGLHRINWDLRHGDPEQPDRWARYDDPDYARPPNQSGEVWVSPGQYTVTLKARGVESSKTVDVVGDPLLTLTDADYRATESFLLQAASLVELAEGAAQAAGITEEEADRREALAEAVQGLTRGYGDSGRFGDGNFGPPTGAQISRLNELEEEIEAVSPPG